jgi:riboflavin kinase / FMN adenylyltransferase
MKSLYTVWGKVRDGEKRGKRLGFPTANIHLHKHISEGVYISDVATKGKKYIAATFIGRAVTYGGKVYKLESYLLDFHKNIYGSWMTVRLYKKLRGNMKFQSELLLKEQIEKDVRATREFFIPKRVKNRYEL